MNEPIYATGKKVDDAIKEALKELSEKLNKTVSLDDVNVEILNEGGLFSKAKVKITLDESFIKAVIKQEIKPEPKQEEVKVVAAKVEPKKNVEPKTKVNKEEPKKAAEIKTVEPKKEGEAKTTELKKANATLEQKNIEIKNREIKKEEQKSKEPKEIENSVKVDENKYPAGCFIKKLATEMGEGDVQISCEETSRDLYIKILGPNMGKFIGNGGETLSAIQILANVISGQNRETNKRVYVDAGNYKGSKNDRLKDIAKKFAEEVIEVGESRKLKPMNPYERRIVHAYVSETYDLKTKSVGEEPHRCVVIMPKR